MKTFLIFLMLTSPCFALSVFQQTDGNFTIINENGTKATDLSEQFIRDKEKEYNSLYWHMVRSSVDECKKNHGIARGGNFK